MRYSDILLEYKTKDGRNITFDVIEDEEGDKNCGFQLDLFNAYVDGKHAGYLATTYVPEKRVKKHYPGILNWLCSIKGKSILPYDKKNTPWQQLSPDEMRKSILSYFLYHRFPYMQEEEINNLSDDEARNIMTQIEQHAIKKFGKEFINFVKYYADPYESFIRVFTIGDKMGRRGQGDPSENEFKRQGIATALYFKAVDFYAKKGMKMRLSTLRSNEAQGLEKFFKAAGLTISGKPGYYGGQIYQFDYLDPKKIKAYQKKHGLTEELVVKYSYDE